MSKGNDQNQGLAEDCLFRLIAGRAKTVGRDAAFVSPLCLMSGFREDSEGPLCGRGWV